MHFPKIYKFHLKQLYSLLSGTTLILYLLKIISGSEAENANAEERSAVLKRLEEAAREVGDAAIAAPIEKVEVKGSGLPDSKQLTKLAILGMSPS